MTPFQKACKDKFDLGKLEHRQPWDAAHINIPKEISDECCDLYNYADLEPNLELRAAIRMCVEEIWKRYNQ